MSANGNAAGALGAVLRDCRPTRDQIIYDPCIICRTLKKPGALHNRAPFKDWDLLSPGTGSSSARRSIPAPTGRNATMRARPTKPLSWGFASPPGCVEHARLRRQSVLLEALRFSSMRVPRPRQQRFCQQRNVIRPISSVTRLAGTGLRESAASQHGHAPAHRDGGPPLSSTKQRPADRCVGVGITAFADRLDQRIFNSCATCEVAERIMKCNQDPPLLTHEVIWTMTEPCESYLGDPAPPWPPALAQPFLPPPASPFGRRRQRRS
jgi:hypothetical protein